MLYIIRSKNTVKMTQKQEKWSESEGEYKAYSKIVRRLLKKLTKQTTSTKKNPNDWDLEKAIELTSKLGYCLNIKTNLAHKTDLEQRLKYLENINSSKKKHEEFATQ
jgi:hypothetical protein